MRSRGRRTSARRAQPTKMMRTPTLFLAMLLATVISGALGHASEAAADSAPASQLFPHPAALEPQVRFWRTIFAEYSTHQVVVHDALYLDKVYKVLDFRPYLDDGVGSGEVERIQRIETDLETERVRATLLRLHGLGPHPDYLTDEEQRIYDMFKDDPAPD